MEPHLYLRDGRNLVFEPGAARRRLRSFKVSDVLSGSDTRIRQISEDEEEKNRDYGLDFAYADRDGLHAAVELKMSNKPASRRVIDRSFEQINQYATLHQETFDRGELWVLRDNGSILEIRRSDRPGQIERFGLANVVSIGDRLQSDLKRRSPIDSEYVEERVEAWKNLIEQLFHQLGEWSEAAHYRIDRSVTTTMDEELMQLFGVAPTTLPILKIYSGKTFVASAMPIGLWVIGASGRVDVLTAKKSASIVNRSSDPAVAKWSMYESKVQGVPLTQRAFIDFIGEQ